MQTTSATWKRLWAAGAPLEARATIAGTVYAEISAPVIHRAAMQERLSVGNVAAASLTLSVRGGLAIPRSAAVVIEARLNDGATASEWLPQGTFYVSRRARDPVTGAVALECYDALLKANAVWTPSQGSWPRTMAAVAAELLALLGLEMDSRTAIPSGAAFAMSEPAAGTTIRDALGTIAQAGGGNWIVTPAGKLRLVPVADAADAGEAEADALDVTGTTGAMDAGAAGTITGVRCTADGTVTLTGDDSGIVVDVDLAPAIAAEVADLLIGLRYQAYRLTGAICDPSAELGDYVRAGAHGEIASALYSQQIALGPACRSAIAAPEAGELTDEYPYIGGSEKTLALAKAYAAQAVDALDSDLTQQEIFNRLTDGGAAQGLVLYNGQLYINASYIRSGTLTLGGQNNTNGTLRVLNANGDQIGLWSNAGLACQGFGGVKAIDVTMPNYLNVSGKVEIGSSSAPVYILLNNSSSGLTRRMGANYNGLYVSDWDDNNRSDLRSYGLSVNRYTSDQTHRPIIAFDDEVDLEMLEISPHDGIKFFKGTDDGQGDVTYEQRSYLNDNAHVYGSLSVGSGGTLNGTLTVKNYPIWLRNSATDLTASNNGSTETLYHSIWGVDKEERSWFCCEGYTSANGNVSAFLGVRNYSTDGTAQTWKGITIEEAKDDTLRYVISDADKFRSAISVPLIKNGRTALSFTNGVATAPFSTFGVSSRPTTLVMTPTSDHAVVRYAYEDSSGQVNITARKTDGTNYSGNLTVCWICIQ